MIITVEAQPVGPIEVADPAVGLVVESVERVAGVQHRRPRQIRVDAARHLTGQFAETSTSTTSTTSEWYRQSVLKTVLF